MGRPTKDRRGVYHDDTRTLATLADAVMRDASIPAASREKAVRCLNDAKVELDNVTMNTLRARK